MWCAVQNLCCVLKAKPFNQTHREVSILFWTSRIHLLVSSSSSLTLKTSKTRVNLQRPAGHCEKIWFASICKLIFGIPYSLVLKTRQQAPSGGTYSKHRVTKLDFITAPLTQKWNPTSANQESPDQTGWITGLLNEPLPSPKGSDFAITSRFCQV